MSRVTVTKRTLVEGHCTPHSPDSKPVVGTIRAIRAELDNGAVILWPINEPTDADLLAFATETGVA